MEGKPAGLPMPLQASVEHLYALAQVLVPDAKQAARLVEQTCRVVFARPGPHDRLGMIRTMLSLHRASGALSVVEPGEVPPPEVISEEALQPLTTRAVGRVFPFVWATLPPGRRLLLWLDTVEHFDAETIGALTGQPPATVQTELDEARKALTTGVLMGLSETERAVVQPVSPSVWIPMALQTLREQEWTVLPPTLLSMPPPPAPSETSPSAQHKTPEAAVPPSGRRHPRGRQVVVVLCLILVTGVLGYYVSVWLSGGQLPALVEASESSSIVLLTASQPDSFDLVMTTESPEQVTAFVQERLDWRLAVPLIEGASLQGVTLREISEDVEIPVLQFDDRQIRQPILVYVFDYRLLDLYSDRLSLEADIQNQIVAEQHYDLHDLGEKQVLVWRHRDDIYLAVTRGEAETLQGRIAFAF
jgi:hypothetical protein